MVLRSLDLPTDVGSTERRTTVVTGERRELLWRSRSSSRRRPTRPQRRKRLERAAQTQILAVEARKAYNAWDAAKLKDPMSRVDGIMLKKGEVAHGVLDGAGYIEPKRAPGHWAGRSSGYSVRVAKGLNYRVGSNRGHFVQGEEKPTVTDTGLFVVTSQRCIFVGQKKTTEWAFDKLVGYSLDGEAIAIFNVSNRQKATGVMYTVAVEPMFDSMIAAAIARFQGEDAHAEVVAELAADYQTAHAAWQQSQAAPRRGGHPP